MELVTTIIELNAINPPAAGGFSIIPWLGSNMPAAMGMAMVLYPNAQNRFC